MTEEKRAMGALFVGKQVESSVGHEGHQIGHQIGHANDPICRSTYQHGFRYPRARSQAFNKLRCFTIAILFLTKKKKRLTFYKLLISFISNLT